MSLEKDIKRKRISFSSTSSSENCGTPLRKRTIRDYFTPDNMESQDNVLVEENDQIDMNSDNLSQLSDRQLLLKLAGDMNELKQNTKYIAADIEDLKSKNQSLESTVESQQCEIQMLKNELEKVKLAQLNDQARSMRSNLIFENLNIEKGEDIEASLRTMLTTELEIKDTSQIIIERVHFLYQPSDRNRKPPIVAKFLCFKDKDRIWKSKSKLKDNKSKVFIREQFPMEIENNRRQIMPVFFEAKRFDNTTYMVKDEIRFRSGVYTVQTIDKLLAQLPDRGQRVGMRIQNNVCEFLGKYCPLSNFYRCTFDMDGKRYSCVEQGYQAAKAEYYGRADLVESVMTTEDPRMMKRYGDEIRDRDWITSGTAKETMCRLLRAKFDQCELPQEALKSTGNMTLVEANAHDTYWGAGMSKGNINIGNPQYYKGQNMLGQLMLKIRNEKV